MSIQAYRAALRSNVRALWSGVINQSQFQDEMGLVINRRLSQAWDEGANECGIKPNEFTDEENLIITQRIRQELNFVAGFSSDINDKSKANKGKLGPFLQRVDTWTNRYTEVKMKASAVVCGNLKKVWRLGASEHCPSCLKLEGKVKRNSFWENSGILPRVPGAGYLKCRGYKCQCTLQDTSLPISKGGLPRLP